MVPPATDYTWFDDGFPALAQAYCLGLLEVMGSSGTGQCEFDAAQRLDRYVPFFEGLVI